MQRPAKKLDRYAVEFATSMASSHYKDILTRVYEAKIDANKPKRLKKKSECKVCFYINKDRIGGAAMTKQPCGICGEVVWYGSTNTDVLCLDCAIKHSLCKHCGGDREMRRQRRKFDWIPPTKPQPAEHEGVRLMSPMILLPKREA